MQEHIRLSSSTLGIYQECPRCFYAHVGHNVKRPDGPFPSLPNGMDRIIKTYCDKFRGALPAEFVGKVPGVLFPDMDQMKKFRQWQSGLKANVSTPHGSVQLIGALDDLLMGPGVYSPIDFKTRGSAPKESGDGYYGRQADCYSLLLRENGLEPSGLAYLAYWYPESVEIGWSVKFGVSVYEISADPERAFSLLCEAMAVLAGGEPEASEACKFCAWAQVRVDAAVKVVAAVS